ncbi:copper homeostasis protein cutC homolog isoform X3 [Arvicola amphibius]|uniref:copper homeostasis protein cutC homolog isoform X3 n=1 Tax=Arvicola amphibius TaxID=1047088 RepID=UPI0018E38453|nr:copper homeostasis protein cutC homolog isoform X3 [Arvicola amphibius]
MRLRLYGTRASGTRLLGGSRSRGDSVETEGERGRKAGSMKKGASCDRKPAWMPSGKAGAPNGFLMEVCVDSVESAVNAERGGAGRIELCAGLLEGGTTPSMGILQVVKQSVQIPVFVMIRPRGGDFLYSDREIEVMKADIRLAKLYGADGLVFGALTEDGHIDKELCMSLVAFDMVHDPMAALETLLTLGFERVLTSGCDSSALEGLPLIKQLIDEAKGRIVVMPGGGITDKNLQRILEGSGATEFHCSARSSRDSGMKFRNSSVAMGASLAHSEYSLKVTDVTKVRTLYAIARDILV